MLNGGTGPKSDFNVEPKIQEQVSKYLELAEKGVDSATLSKMESEIAKNLKNQYKLANFLPKFLKNAASKRSNRLEIRLANQDKKLEDNREKTAKEKVKSKKFIAENALKEGAKSEKSIDQKTLSKFEKMLVKRFQQGQTIAQENKSGRANLPKKSKSEWREFFSKFSHRNSLRKTSLKNIKEMIFRGVVTGKGKGVVISDLALSSGRLEKFIRFRVMSQLASILSQLKPGEGIPKEMLAKLNAQELIYMALAARRGKNFAFAPKATEGKFTKGAIEERAASNLSMPLSEDLKKKAKLLKGKKLGGFGGALYNKDGEGEAPYRRFVPWWLPDMRKPNGKWNFSRILFYLSLIAVAIIGIGVITMRLISG